VSLSCTVHEMISEKALSLVQRAFRIQSVGLSRGLLWVLLCVSQRSASSLMMCSAAMEPSG